MLIHNSLQIAVVREIATRMIHVVRVFIDMHIFKEERSHEGLRGLDTISSRVNLNLGWILSIFKVEYLLTLLALQVKV